jgi:hypothetical protein
LIGGNIAHYGDREVIRGPPTATLSRRAQSYSDFHYAVQAVLEPGSKDKEKEKKEVPEIKDEFSFDDWYQDLEEELHEASHDEYR